MLYSEMAQVIADKARVRLTAEESERLAKTRQVNPEAYEAVLKGDFHWAKFTEQDIEIALQYYELAIKKDPNYAQAYAGIASVWRGRAYFGIPPSKVWPKIKAAEDKCSELDSTLARIGFPGTATWFEFDWDKADRGFRLTLEFNPNDARTRIFYGLFLSGMKRFEEALAQMQLGLELDPLNAMNQGYLGKVLMRARQLDQAIAQYKKSLALQPDFVDSLSGLIHCYHQKGMYEEALEVARRFFNARGFKNLLQAFNRGNEEGGYKEAMRQAAEAWAAQSNRAYSMRIATLYTYAGEKDRALDWLEIAYQEKMLNLVYLNVQPKWDLLRDDPRFHDLIRKMNFPPVK
jgi:tetratricopeptide (TPR) repeat protein